MARPLKEGVDYFPLDTELDNKMDFVEQKYGNDGFAVVVKLWQKIYGEDGYFCKWNEDVALMFAMKKANNISIDKLNGIVELALYREIFDETLYKRYGILTSAGIQKRYLLMTARRNRVEFEEKYLLIGMPKKTVNVYINGVNVYKNSKNADNNPQSKVKESKVKESKVKESKVGKSAPALLTKEEYDALSSEFGGNTVDEYIKRVNAYCEETGKKYANPALTIRKWILQDKDKPARPNRFNNYTDTNKIDYKAYEDQILKEMLEE